jgi:tRNA(Ile2) C34 agmatinyltransferase TiaS
MIMVEQKDKPVCKNCGSTAVVRFGTYKGVQRYWCKTCKRKFKADNAENLAILPREEELPSPSEIRGMSPDFTGELTTEEYIRSLRE